MAAFLVDAQLPPGLAFFLRESSHQAWHVQEIGMGAAKDREIAAKAISLKAVLVSKDDDFALMKQAGNFPGRLLWVRCGNTSNSDIRARFKNALPEILSAFENGETLVELD